MAKKTVTIVGGGPSGILLADLLGDDFQVTIYEKEKTIGRKFLVAGNGGFNLTNVLSGKELVAKYQASGVLDDAIRYFDSGKVRGWLAELGIRTFVGSSGRVFPEQGIKPVEVLAAIKQSLKKKKVNVLTGYQFTRVNENNDIELIAGNETKIVKSDFKVLALGGASWSGTGSDGRWLSILENKGVSCKTFQSSNCGVNINWPSQILEHYAGKPLKNIALSVEGKVVKGEALITDYGLEGNAVYPLISEVRSILNKGRKPEISIDFKPLNSLLQLRKRIGRNHDYKKINLNRVDLALLKSFTTKEEYLDKELFLEKIKELKITIEGLRPVEEAISTVGGIDIEEVTEDFELKKIPNTYVTGEMLDWDTSTGGFLLQGCFSMSAWVARSIQKSSRG